MATATDLTYTGKGIQESFQDIIYNISPEDTPLLSMAKKKTASSTHHQWLYDSLKAAGTNAVKEGDEATYATSSGPGSLCNYTQISTKSLYVSNTFEAVKKYGRKSEVAYQLMKAGKELKRDMEHALITNQGTVGGSATAARQCGGLESWIGTETNDDSVGTEGTAPTEWAGNGIVATGATGTPKTPGYNQVTHLVVPPTDAPTTTPGGAVFTEADLKKALTAAWEDGGNPSVIFVSASNKAKFSSFSGVTQKNYQVNGTSSAVVTAAADVYVSDFGVHTVKLSRQSRSNTVLCVDPDHVAVAMLRPMEKTELAKTGDASKYLLTTEYTLEIGNPDAHAKIEGLEVN